MVLFPFLEGRHPFYFLQDKYLCHVIADSANTFRLQKQRLCLQPQSPKGKLTLATEDLKKRRARSDRWAVPAKPSAACEGVADTSEAVTEQLLSTTDFLSWQWHHSSSSRPGWKLKLSSCTSCASVSIHLAGALELLTCCHTAICKDFIITLLNTALWDKLRLYYGKATFPIEPPEPTSQDYKSAVSHL